MLKTYQFKTHCKGDSHSSKIANIIWLALVTKQVIALCFVVSTSPGHMIYAISQ